MTIQEEANHIILITKTFFPEDKIKELLIKLDEEVGRKSKNPTTQILLSELRKIVDQPLPPPPLWLWVSFYTLVTTHILLVIAFFTSFFVLPFTAPWYVAVPCMTFIWFFSTTKVECQLTNLENSIRKTLGMKKIGGFVGFYFLKPIKLIILKSRKRKAGTGN